MFYNSVAQRRIEVVYVVVEDVNVQVTNAEDVPIPCQINPVLDRSSLLVHNQFQVTDFMDSVLDLSHILQYWDFLPLDFDDLGTSRAQNTQCI